MGDGPERWAGRGVYRRVVIDQAQLQEGMPGAGFTDGEPNAGKGRVHVVIEALMIGRRLKGSRLAFRFIIGAALLLLAVVSLAGCGGGESPESAALKEEKKAGEYFVEGDGAGFCEQLTGKESRAIIEKYGAKVGTNDCGRIMDAIFKLIGPDEVATLEEEESEITTDDVKVHGKTAIIEWPHSSPDELIEAGGHWYLNDKGEIE